MGSDSSKHLDITQFNPSQWQQIGIHRQMSKIVQNTIDKGQAQLQTISFNPKHDMQKELGIYQYRKNQDSALVKCLGVLEQKVKSPTICGSSQALKVLTQRIPLRLNQLPKLSFLQSLYTLSESLRGYKNCYNKLGAFNVDDQMIGINSQGDVKVWVNQNFAENHPSIQKPLLQTSGSQINEQEIPQSILQKKDEADMVSNIIQVIERKSQFGKYPQQFANLIYRRPMTFDESFKQIYQFTKAKNIFVPNKLLTQNIQTNNFQKEIHTTIDRTSNNQIARQLFTDQPIPQSLQSGHISSPIIYDKSNTNSNQLINSPIKGLFQQPIQGDIVSPRQNNFVLPPTSPRSNPMGSKVTFRLMSPQNSTVSFQNQNSQFIHKS